MKKHLLLFISAVAALTANAQTALPNGNFENWTASTYDYPTGYIQNSNPQTFYQCHTAFNATKSTDSYHGGFALQLTTNASATDTCFGFIANPTNTGASGGPSTWTGGMPMTEKPSGIRGYYKYNVASADSAMIIVVARQGGMNVGTYFYTLGGIHASYTLFQFAFSPALSVIPDSIIFATVSSNPMVGNGMPGSTLLMDSVSFTGITTQPLPLNGDFENWQSQTIESVDQWVNQSGGNGMSSVTKTTDKKAGNFAAELITYLGDNNGVPRAQGANLSTGYWDNSCSCQKGGYPFSNQVDTLAFWYKYAPMAGDSANVNLNFKSAGVNIWNTGARFHAAATYQYMEIPFNLASAPDSVIISVQSSDWNDTALVFVGSDLKIDEMHFKSQPLATGIKPLNFKMDDVSFYPNPFTTVGTIVISPSVNTAGMIVKIYDVTGRVVKGIVTDDHRITIDRNNMQNGIYFYEVKTANNMTKTGKIVVE